MFERIASGLVLMTSLSGCSLLFEAASPQAETRDAAVDRDGSAAEVDAADESWYDTEFANRIRFTVTNPVAEELLDFPILLVIDSDALDASRLRDLENARLILDGQLVPHELDVGAQDRGIRANLWFAASLDAAETHTYELYFGSSLANEGSTTEVWQSYLRVWHLGEMQGAYAESASGMAGNGGERLAEGVPGAGRIGGGVVAGGGGAEPMAKTPEPFAEPQPLCLSITGWVKPNVDSGARNIARAIVDTSGTTPDLGYRLSYSDRGQGGPTATFSLATSNDTDMPLAEELLLPPEEWAWVGMSLYQGAAGPQAQLYVNGATAGATVVFLSAPTISADVNVLSIGSRIDGTLDEVRISDTCRTDGWMSAQYQAMTPPYLPVLEEVEDRP